MKLRIPELALIALVGPSGSGKSTFAKRCFKPTEVISSDFSRGLISDDENDQSVTSDAFELVHFIARKRLQLRRPVVIDATNVQQEARKPLVAIAREYHAVPVAIVLNTPEKICAARNEGRGDRQFGRHVVRQQHQQMRRSLRSLEREGFRYVHVLRTEEEVGATEIEWEKLWTDRRDEQGPFDIIGDVHGCDEELAELLEKLGYEIDQDEAGSATQARPPEGRRAIFLGDLADRGPDTPGVLRLVMNMVESGVALCVPGNHDVKLARSLRGRNVQVTHGLAESLEQMGRESPEFATEVCEFVEGLRSHYWLDDGKLAVAHAGMTEAMVGRASRAVRDFALFGETTGETDEFGLPVRSDWASSYRGETTVVYGHTPVAEPEWVNRTINVDTGCVFGGRLTALRYPEKELVSVPSRRTYYEPAKPFLPDASAARKADERPEMILDINDVMGKRVVSTRLAGHVTVREENAAAALEVMTRFAVNPKWLIYLPPTMSPTETSAVDGLLEHPAEAFSYYRNNGVPTVVVEEKHMGSRAVAIVCQSAEVAKTRFGISERSTPGTLYTRTGRRFLNDVAVEAEIVERIRDALDKTGLWKELDTDWVCLDCEVMPWSIKAQELIEQQYATVGAAGKAATAEAVALLGRAVDVPGVSAIRDVHDARKRAIDSYVEAYRAYSLPFESAGDLRIAPFHVMASEGAVHVDRDHLWHMAIGKRLAEADPELILATDHRAVDVTDPESEELACSWWQELTERGGEGVVVKPLGFVAGGKRGLVQPGVKCRGRDYLRIIYGPDYTAPQHLERLKSRGLSAKRSLARREFALGVEALERFVRREPLYRVHECAFGVLALESEPVDPRL